MAQPAVRFTRVPRLVTSIALAVVVILALAWAVRFMQDADAPERILLEWFTRLRMTDQAAALSAQGLDLLTSKLIFAGVAMVAGVGGVWALFWVASDLAEILPFRWRQRVMPIIFVGPAAFMLGTFLVYPALNTIYTSLSEDIIRLPEVVPEQYWLSDTITADFVGDTPGLVFDGYLLDVPQFEVARVHDEERSFLLITRAATITDPDADTSRRVYAFTTLGLRNYAAAFTSPDMQIAFRNNLLWLIIGTGGSVVFGLVIAALVDRIRYEPTAKSIIFMPLAISFVGASVIWKFVYAWQPPGRPQVGLLNALVTLFGGQPVPWIIETPFNNLILIIIMIWLQTGFCMIIFSAAIKGIPHEIVEAARIDGANDLQIFFRVTIPMIRGTLLTVTTTVFIATLKVFDIVYVMTKGNYDTEVIANRMFVEMFTFRNYGRASSLAVILLLVVIPIMVLNIRNLRRQGINE